MVYKLKPLELSFDFEDRVYDLGDTVDLQVTLTPTQRRGRERWACRSRLRPAIRPEGDHVCSLRSVPMASSGSNA